MSIFEDLGGTYIRNGDYLIPDIALSKTTSYPIGKYGKQYLNFIKKHRNMFYQLLLSQGKLNNHLHEIDVYASEKIDNLVRQMAKQQGITEELKKNDQMQWVGRMNNIKHCAEEIILKEVMDM